MKKKKIIIITFLAVIGLILAGMKVISSAEEPEVSTITPPAGVEAEIPNYVEGGIEVLQAQPVIRVYKDFNAWWGENRDYATLLAIGKVLGVDYFIHPMSALLNPIPAGTKVVLITSNSYGWSSTRNTQNSPVAQANLDAFVRAGGILIVDMGDNDYGGGFLAPGSTGTPNMVFPSPCRDVTLDPGAVTANHPFIIGPDGIPGTADDLNNSNIDLPTGCHVAHGNLIDGITLPADAQVLMTAAFGGVQKAVLAEYCLGGGRVILDTLTKEFVAQNPFGTGPSYIMRNLFSYALSPQAVCEIEVSVDIKPGSCPNPLSLTSKGVLTVAILGTEDFDVAAIDPATIRLSREEIEEEVSPIRWAYEDVATPFEGELYDCHDLDGDGYLDLTLKFDTQELVEILVLADFEEQTIPLVLTGNLKEEEDRIPIRGSDCVRIQ